MRITEVISQLLDVPSTDPDDRRRSQLLNILLLGSLVMSLLAILATAIVDIVGVEGYENIGVLYLAPIILSVGIIIIGGINRNGPVWLASSLFLLLLIALFALSDEPQEVANGRSLLLLSVPIIMASVLLHPYASFIAAGLDVLVITVISLSLQLLPNPFPILAFFVIALISWLSARSLERALEDLRTINRELDQRVEQRTRELAEALSRNQAILAGIADGVIVFDNDGKAIVANPAITGLLERPVDEIIGHDIETLMGAGIDADDQAAVVAPLRNRETRYPSVKFEWDDKTLSMSAAPVRVAPEEIIGTVAVFRDFTREAEIDRMKSAFVSMASHELRTPLNAILGYADMLQEGVYGPLPDRQHEVLARIIANAGELLSLASNLLDQAQIEAGTLTLNVTSFTLADLIDGVQGVMSVLAQAKGLELTSHIADDVPTTLSGDPQRLHQILINLVGNAIKFTKEGAVCIDAYRPDADHWTLEVSDTGCGIPAEAQPHIFEPFQQVDSSPNREHTGAGLGLSIVRQLTTLMDSEITLTSEVGHGSTFTIVLPLVPTQENFP